jgi:hypothetical protein
MNVERRLLQGEPSGNSPERKPPLANDYFPRIEFLNPLAVTQAGLYDRIVKLPKPVKAWHPASKGVAERFKGCLSDVFPELKDLSEEDLKEIERKRHKL